MYIDNDDSDSDEGVSSIDHKHVKYFMARSGY